MEVICEEILHLEASLTMMPAAQQLNLALQRKRLQMMQMQEITPVAYPKACAAIYSHARREVWLFGDCQCMIIIYEYKEDR